MSFLFSCPVCGNQLERKDKLLRCSEGHCYDIAKQGYVNLLQSQKSSSKRHGDDKLMVKSRFDFLNRGYYDCLINYVTETVYKHSFKGMKLLDLGCGECKYSSAVLEKCSDIDVGGIDISKQALIVGSRRNSNMSLAVASIFSLPVIDNYCDFVMSIFAPDSIDEIKRVLKKDGYWLRVYPLERHLIGLKSVIYEKPYLNKVDRSIPNGFELSQREEIRRMIVIENNTDIINLFRMTPYFYKTGRIDQQKLDCFNRLDTEIEFGIDVYKKK